jgi:ABC-type amino acid transport substrate-binding protein
MLFRACLTVAFAVFVTPVVAAEVGGALADIKSSGVLKLAYRSDTPPFSSLNQTTKQPEGFTIDLCRIIAGDIQKALGLDSMNIEWVQVTAENRLTTISNGDAHMECAATTITLSRQEQVDFSNLFYVTGASLMRWANVPINSVSDLRGKKVSVIAGTTTEKVLRDRLATDNIKAEVVTVGDHAAALRMLIDRDIDAMAGDQATLFGIGVKTDGVDDLRLTSDMLSFEPYALPLPRNDADFRLVVNRSLSELYKRGDVGRSWEVWFGELGLKPSRILMTLYRLNSFVE